MMKLRVLTGRHAGADLSLITSTQVISAAPEADIGITDWTEAPLVLTFLSDESGMNTVTLQWGIDRPQEPWEPLSPRRFGAVALCFGPIDAVWPSDIDLLDQLLRPPLPAPVASDEALPSGGMTRKRKLMVSAGAIGAAGLLAAFVMILPPPEVPVAEPTLMTKAYRIIEAVGYHEITVRDAGTGIVIEGLVKTTAELNRLRAALSGLPADRVNEQFAAANDVAQTIADALQAPGVSVNYIGRGDFVVQGGAVGAASLHSAADRLVNDLKPLVKSIRLSVVDLPPPQRTPTGAMLQTQGMEYVQTRDGVKHISLRSKPVLIGYNAIDPGPYNPSPTTNDRSEPNE